jgi:hypothetical protein
MVCADSENAVHDLVDRTARASARADTRSYLPFRGARFRR